jgi:hypothetical protein
LGVQCGGIELPVAEQNLDQADIDLLSGQVSREAVALVSRGK